MMNTIRFGARVTIEQPEAVRKAFGDETFRTLEQKAGELKTALQEWPDDRVFITVGTKEVTVEDNSVPHFPTTVRKNVVGITAAVQDKNGERHSEDLTRRVIWNPFTNTEVGVSPIHLETMGRFFNRAKTTAESLAKKHGVQKNA